METNKVSFKTISISLLIIAGVISFLFLQKDFRDRAVSPANRVKIAINEAVFEADLARTSAELQKGLSGRDALKLNEGMWFDFGSENRWGIWMKDMKFSIDIVWFDKNLQIISITENISPETFPEVYFPIQAASYVLELQAGAVDKFGLKEGDSAKVDKIFY